MTVCSHSSLEVKEPLPGTAPRGDVWMLLEYDGIWGEQAFKESKLPKLVKSHLNDLLDQIPFCKLLLIRQHLARRVSRHGDRLSINHRQLGIRFYLARTTEHEPLLYDFRLGQYEDLLDLDIQAALSGSGIYTNHISDQVLTLICTNGRRDWCCARYGPGIYHEMIQAADESPGPLSIWQSSHLGGHRFAPNIVCFPQGIFYGRIEKDELVIFLNQIRQGQMYAPKARGRVSYPAPVQAAEIYLRQRLGSNEQLDFQLLDAHERQSGEWLVRFKTLDNGQINSLEIKKEITPDRVFKSCNDTATSPVVIYKLMR